MFQKINEFLEGKRTYIVTILVAIFNFGVFMGWWGPDNAAVVVINSVLAALGLGFLRAGIGTERKKIE